MWIIDTLLPWLKPKRRDDSLLASIVEQYKQQLESVNTTGTFCVWMIRDEENEIQPRRRIEIDGVKFIAHSFDYDPDAICITFRRE